MTGPDPAVLVAPAYLARRLRLPDPYDADLLWLLAERVQAATVEVETYLGRYVLPRTWTQQHVAQNWDGTWALDAVDVTAVTNPVAELDGNNQPTGLWTVTVTAGLDARTDVRCQPVIQRVQEVVLADPRILAAARAAGGPDSRPTQAVSVDGQSISFDTSATVIRTRASAVENHGTVPPLSDLDDLRIAGLDVYQRPGTYHPEWPYRALPGMPWGPW